MNHFNPAKHDRRSIRLKGYDYSRAGLYFITICAQNREHLFGNIEIPEGTDLRACPCPNTDGDQVAPQMKLNHAGHMLTKWYFELENKFHDIRCHAMIVMPDHFHCIIQNTGTISVGADLRVCPNTAPGEPNDTKNPETISVGADLRVCPNTAPGEPIVFGERGEPIVFGERGEPIVFGERGEHIGSPLHRVVQWFKTMTTNEYIRGVKNYGWKPINGKLWQRNYYEHIIRDEVSFQNITNYIHNNPANWLSDTLRSD
jgi:REP element-mobilizing transposase RayT